MNALLASFAALVGAVVGSFLNVVIHRVPLGLSIVRPASSCPSCNRPIRPLDNVPILSYLVLRGRCRHCRASISPRYVLVELATAILFAAAVLRFGATEAAVFVACSGAVLISLTGIDLEHRRLPNVIVLPSTVVALVWVGVVSLVTADVQLFLTAVVGGIAAFFLFLVIALVSGGMGFGDVKLAGFIGVVTGRFDWPTTVGAIFAAFFIGGAIAVGLLLMGRAGRKSKIPFGPSIAAGAIAAMFAGPGPVEAWLGF